MSLTIKDIKDAQRILNKLLPNQELSKDDIIAILRGPVLQEKIDNMYYSVFKPTLKWGVSLVNQGEEASELEIEIVDKILEKLNEYFIS